MNVIRWVDKLREALTRPFAVRFTLRVYDEVLKDDVASYAASISYHAFISLFPLIIGLVGLFGFIVPSTDLQSRITSFFQDNLPNQANVFEGYLRQLIQNRGVLTIIGVIGSIWTGSGLVSTLGHAVNRCWDILIDMHYWMRKPRDIGLTIGFGILFIAGIVSFWASSTPSFSTFSSPVRVLIRTGGLVLSIAVFFFIFLVSFKVMPNTRTYWRHLWPGALLTAFLFTLGNQLLLFYFTYFTNYEQVYGPIATIIVLLVWIYYDAFIVLVGSEIAAEYSRVRRGLPKVMHTKSFA